MKKSLIALAVLAASGAAMAQSTVTLYGIADVWVGSTKDSGATNTQRQTVMGSGGYNGNRFGLRGSEDLGGGLKANFVLEQGFTIDDGNGPDSDSTAAGIQMTQAFQRAAWIGLSGGFGEVRFGRQLTAYDTLRAATNNSFDSAFATTGTVWSRGVADYTNRVNNQIQYISPTVSGFTGAVTLGLGENKTATESATDVTAFHLRYAAGPLLVGIAYQNEETRNTAGVNTPDRSYTLVAGSYNFGVATLTAGFNRAKQNGTGRDNEYQLGVNVPLSGASSIALGYTRASLKDAAGADAGKASGISLTGFYDLSKRTRLYAGINDTTTKNAAGATTRETSLVAVGLRHSF